jgi:3-hydroxybutyryl-CoA dehydrogenase
MIINEAFYALSDNVSSKQEIDVAMQLGTNYPFGPFEWADQIGVNNVLKLLDKLTETDRRYTPAPLLQSFVSSK